MSRIKKKDLYIMIGITPEQLVQDINDIAYRNRMNYIDATVYYCEKNNLDIESVGKLVPSSLKSKIEESAREVRMLKKQYNNISTLPI
jgi:hypothetical protein